jgi:hypothetical protein
MSVGRIAHGVLLAALAAFLGWRVIAAELQRRAPPFEGTAAERLSRAPLDGDAFSDLALAEREGRDPVAMVPLHEIAARRDPRDLRVRAWLADQYMRAGDYPAAMAQIDVLLKLERQYREAVPPMMAIWAEDPAFARVLADKLRQDPPWSRTMMDVLQKEVRRPGASGVLAALRASGDMDEAETGRLLEALMRAGQWDVAYSQWEDAVTGPGGPALPLLYNGDFEQVPSAQGFDWRTPRRPGSYVEFQPADGAQGRAAHVVFLGRPVDYADLEHPLALPAGAYVLRFRARAIGLRTAQGLQWTVTCSGPPRALGSSEPLDGSFEWRDIAVPLTVPAEGCPGQWLRLANPAPRGSARIVSGEAWFDDMRIEVATDPPVSGPPTAAR